MAPPQVRPLFSGKPIREALADQRQRVAMAIAQLRADVFLASGLDDIAAELVGTYRIDPLVLDWAAMKVEPHKVEVDLGAEAKGAMSDATQSSRVLGKEVTYFVPFSGTPGLFDMRPSTHTGDPPGGFVRGAELEISCSGIDADPSTFRSDFERQESDIKAWVAWINTDVDPFNTDLRGEVRAQLEARFDKPRADADLAATLGAPLHQRPPGLREDVDTSARRLPAVPRHESAPDPRRGPGRPGWTRELFEEHWRH